MEDLVTCFRSFVGKLTVELTAELMLEERCMVFYWHCLCGLHKSAGSLLQPWLRAQEEAGIYDCTCGATVTPEVSPMESSRLAL